MMVLDNNDVLFASLVGSGVVKSIPQLSLIQAELNKHVLPVLPLLQPKENNVAVRRQAAEELDNLWQADVPTPEENQFFPLSFSIDEGNSWFLLPYETIINITGKNTIVRRSVAKWKPVPGVTERKGTVKERWNQDDYQIDITGVLMGSLLTGNVEDCFPRADFEKLRRVLTAPKSIKVKCPPLELLGISNIVIEDFSFPFTKGENVQAYTIKAYSDFPFNLILD